MKAKYSYAPSPEVHAARATLQQEYVSMRQARERLADAEKDALQALGHLFDEQDRDEAVRMRIRQNLQQNSAVR